MAEWSIDPQRIGMIGFSARPRLPRGAADRFGKRTSSAGAHLTGAAGTHFDKRISAPVDNIYKTSCRPDFAILAYPGYLVVKGTEVLVPPIRIPAGTPPFFLMHAGDDTMAPVTHSVVMYLALKRAVIP